MQHYFLVHCLKAVRSFHMWATHHPIDLGELYAFFAMSSKRHISDFRRGDITDDLVLTINQIMYSVFMGTAVAQ